MAGIEDFDRLLGENAGAPTAAPTAAVPQPTGNVSRLDELLAAEPAGSTPAAAEPAPSGITGHLKAIGSGLLGGATEAAALQGQAEAPISGIAPETMPSPQEAKKIAEQEVTGPLPEYTSGIGGYEQRIGEFLGNPATYIGPWAKAAPLTTSIVSALASEGAHQALQGTGALQTAGEITAGLIGGHLPNHVNKAITTSALRNAETVDNLINGSGNLYEKAYNSGVSITPQAGHDWAYDIISDLRKEGFRPGASVAAKGAFDNIAELADVANYNQLGNLGIPEIDTIRKGLNQFGKSEDRTARAIARYGISKIDENLSNIANNPQWIATGHQNAARAASDITQARALYGAAMRSDALVDAFDSAVEKAKARAGRTGKGGNIENTMRQELGKIADSRVKRRGFTDDEVQTLRDISMGSTKTNLLRGISAMAPTGIVSGTLGLELGHLLFGGYKAMFGLPAAGMGAKWLGERATRQAIEDVAARTRLRGSGAPQPPSYRPATGYRWPLFLSAFNPETQTRGGAVRRALRAAKKR